MSSQSDPEVNKPPITPEVLPSTSGANRSNATTAATKPKKAALLKWFRRITAYAVNFVLVSFLFGWVDWYSVCRNAASRLQGIVGVPGGTVLFLLATVGFLLLTQIRLRWILFLPVYLIFTPSVFITLYFLGWVAEPLLRTIFQKLNPEEYARIVAKERRIKSLLARIWVGLWILWIVLSTGYDAPWMSWGPAVLSLPIWFSCLRWAYRQAVAPKSVTARAIDYCLEKIDKHRVSLNDPTYQRERTTLYLRWWSFVAKAVVKRYRGKSPLVTIHREAIVVFSVSLIATVVTSCVAFGLISQALWRTDPSILSAYAFFTTGSFLEGLIWALGCMTTTINFPGMSASLALKGLHAVILLIGLFQFTYLIACFSIMTSTGAHWANEHMAETVDRLEESTKFIETLLADEKIKSERRS